ncbi:MULTISPECIES: hypothetical protein [Microbacterium]|uniref:PepSY domain-containing protein n=1 Tax=Microbacterium saccharophilum TaxID=1213358 RepID=A0A7Z7D182_9MICO|nr:MULTISPECIES: hypothetical protein [Microbacterium]SFI68109.1 hypothetical protein SAMN04487751_2610 [Microbacterium saccharophilum]
MNSHDSSSADRTPADDQPTQDFHAPAAVPAASEPVPADDTATRRRFSRPVMIGAAAAGILLVGGLGAGIGFALADLDDDDDVLEGAPSSSSATVTSGDDRDDDGEDAVAPGAPASPDDFVAAIDKAITAADASGATSIEREGSGWSVDVVLADGTEADVRIAADGAATVRPDDDGKQSNDPLLDTSRVAEIAAAAIAAAGGGSMDAIETDADDSHAFDVSVDLGGGRDADVALSETLEVVQVEQD